jgi:hypothetical protein
MISCSSVYQFAIEVQEPAPLSLPPYITNVLIVNNSVPQPDSTGISLIIQEKPYEGGEVRLDSAAKRAVISFATHLRETRFFDQVASLSVSIRSDSNWMNTLTLPETLKSQAFDTLGFNGIISIDRFFLQFFQKMSDRYNNAINLRSSADCSIYVNGKQNPFTSFTVSDSLTFIGIDGGARYILDKYSESLIEYYATIIGEKLSQQIVPGWSEKARYFYTGYQSRMREASRFTEKGDWIHAIVLWKEEYEQASKPQMKGKLASNLALAYEMSDLFDIALQWADIAKNHFNENDPANSSLENTRIDTYIKDLKKRIKDNYLLDLQWGVSNNLPRKTE